MSNYDSIESAEDFFYELAYLVKPESYDGVDFDKAEIIKLITARDKTVARRAAEKAWDEGNIAGQEQMDLLSFGKTMNRYEPLTENPYATPEESDE